jgi:hypothetical protein
LTQDLQYPIIHPVCYPIWSMQNPFLRPLTMSSDINKTIEEANCGEWVWSGDDEKVFETIRTLAMNPELSVLGMNGRNYMEKNLMVEHSVQILEQALSK